MMAWQAEVLQRVSSSAITRRTLEIRHSFLPVISTFSTKWSALNDAKLSLSSSSKLPHMSLPHRRHFHTSNVTSKEYPMHTLLPFPALSPTMESGTIAKWEIQEGESFSAGSVLCSIETDKATMDFESQDDGILAKILKDGRNAVDLPIGSPIAVVVEDEKDVAAFADFVLEEGDKATDPAPATTSSTPAAEAPAPAASAPVVGGESGASILLPSARFLAESK
jgi:Biotin-requiring enzyme